LRCVPKLQSDGSRKRLQPIPGRVPPPSDRPIGCGFWPRCFFSVERCQLEKPSLQSSEDIDTRVRCHFYQEIFRNRLQDTDSLNNLNETNSKNKSVHAPILSVSKLTTYYPVRSANLKELFHFKPKKNVKALENATFNLLKMGTLGIVGESGCGKSTLVKTLIGLEERTNGTITFQGNKLAAKISHRNQKQIQEMQMVFQNPDSTMNPCYTVGQQIARPIRKFGIVPKNQIRNKVIKLLEAIRLSEAYYDRFPKQLSGGEKQRVGIARALAINPDLILCDEPVSALDVSVQAAILNLLLEIQHDFNTTYIFISHDLSVVRLISDFICVMYLGNIVEIGPAESIFSPPNHPYTEALLSAIPIPDPKVIQNRIRLEGSVPSAINPPQGCRFRTRCHRKNLLSDPTICQIVPSMQEDKNGHKIFCHIPIEILTNIEPVVKK
jgi:peptide/nickel transport system ATP-binding protein